MEKNIPRRRFKEFVGTGEWEEKKLGSIIRTDSFKTYIKTPQFNGEHIVIQQGKDPIAGYADGEPYLDYEKIILFGDHTLSMYKPRVPFFISTDGVKIIYGLSNIDSEFLLYNLERYKPKNEGYKRYYSILKDKDVYIPNNISEQEKIGDFFQKLDRLIDLNREKLDKLKAYKSAYLEEMFPREGEDRPKRRFKGFTGKWEEKKLGEVVDITMGQSPSSSNYTENPNDYILVQGNADMKKGKVYPRVWTTQVTKKADKNDLILSVRAPVGDIGKTDYDVVLGRGVAGIRGNDFIFQLLNRMKEKEYWKKVSTGSTFESINSNDIKNVAISIPSLAEQEKIGHFFKKLDDQIGLQEEKLEKLEKMKKAYLAEMFV